MPTPRPEGRGRKLPPRRGSPQGRLEDATSITCCAFLTELITIYIQAVQLLIYAFLFGLAFLESPPRTAGPLSVCSTFHLQDPDTPRCMVDAQEILKPRVLNKCVLNQ